MNKILYEICFILFFLSILTAEGSPIVELLSERHRTEWNWVNYRVKLTNKSKMPILDPEIHYYAENTNIQFCEGKNTDAACASIKYGIYPKDSALTAYVDWASPLSNVVFVTSNSKYTIVKIKLKGILYAEQTADVHFRISRKDWTQWSSEKDWSYQRTTETSEPNYFMTVYDASGKILWGMDPITGKREADAVLWTDRGRNIQIGKYDGTSTDSIAVGRFWMLKTLPLSSKEKSLLEDIGVHKMGAMSYQGKSLILCKTDFTIAKSVLNTLMAGFYNAFRADDTIPQKVVFTTKDLYEEKVVCDSFEVCRNEVSLRNMFPLETSCWPDITMDSCKKIVQACGGENIFIDRQLVLSNNSMSSISCLEKHRDVNYAGLQKFGEPLNDLGRSAVNITTLQTGSKWTQALSLSTQPTTEWLTNADYTGEGIVVGVYDTGIYYDHDGFYEGTKKTQINRAYGGTEGLIGGDPYYHGTHVAGIIGGSGAYSKNENDVDGDGKKFKFRGVAPKVKFYAGPMVTDDQIGHVVNHSHVHGYDVYFEENIFGNWKKPSDRGDTLSKIEVVAAGNNGYYAQHGPDVGYHSIKFNSKNAIVVGNYQSYNGLKNIYSSMGPTLDGRIKPDVMAPGSTVEYSFSQQNRLILHIDYIKIYHDGETKPYFTENFDSEIQPGVESSFSSIFSVRDDDADDKYALEWTDDSRPFAGSSYANWRISQFGLNGLNIKKGDLFEFRVKKISGDLVNNYMKGSIYFCAAPGFYDTSSTGKYLHQHVDGIWNLSSTYAISHFKWTEESLNTNFIRFDFNYDFGIVSSVPCNQNGGTCYNDAQGTSMAAPYVSGIAALMYQRYQKMTGEPLNKNSMRNSTAKAILIHTAVDMVDKVGFPRARAVDVYATENRGLNNERKTEWLVKYGKGPDFATGWGKVDGAAALKLFEDYNKSKKQFDKFREFEIENGKEIRWNINVFSNSEKLRLTLVWDDAGGKTNSQIDSKLVNDLDLYLASPSGKYYFPWRLEPLPTESIDINGILDEDIDRQSGLENIKESDIKDAERYCGSNDKILYECFDHRNNVEVVDVDNPEAGTWQIVALGRRIETGNNKDSSAQIASIVSDFPLYESECQMIHPYNPQATYVCDYNFGNNLENFITFDSRTFVDSGDYIYLYDGSGNRIGTYTGSSLAGKRIRTQTNKIRVVLDSDNDGHEGWGFGVTKIEKTPFSIFNMFFESIKRAKKEK